MPSSPRQAQPAQLQPPDHGAGRAHDHDDAEPQPNGDARPWRVDVRSAGRARRGLRALRAAGPSPRRGARGRVRGQPDARRSQRQPAGSRARAAPLDDPRPATQVEREAGRGDVDRDGLPAGVPYPHRGGPAAVEHEPGGRRRQSRASGGLPAPPRARARVRRRADSEHPTHRPMTVKVTVGRVPARRDEGQRRDEPDVRRPGVAGGGARSRGRPDQQVGRGRDRHRRHRAACELTAELASRRCERRKPEREVGGKERRAVNRQRVSGRLVARDRHALRDRCRESHRRPRGRS